jgi:hypothetical protein
MALYIIEPTTRADGAIVVCDAEHNDVAEFFHNEHATVSQTYDKALELATDFVRSAELQKAVFDASVTIHGLIEFPGEQGEWDSAQDLLPRLQALTEAPISSNEVA